MSRTTHRARSWRALAALLAVAALLWASACSNLEGAGEKGYVSGNGQITELPPDARKAPVELTGTDLDGEALSLADYRGKVVAINVWGNWCSECHEEAEDIVEAANRADPDQVAFLGINTRDPSRETAQSFVRRYELPFPSFFDGSTGSSLLAFHGSLTPYATPSTVVLDRQGRVAAVILGEIPSAAVLTTVIEQVVNEDG
ncbi:TlpA disulfide reductase family protein [Nocardioides sp. AE5]|uniref:TlpA disulfide reductase family protein n=1 Tax=Nocardioides sp. AE5 TaxID=2962573 RepID=UPI00288163B9|nr:TlpA disulfide reductase family protein [Nocardioides sp. AE5]MDT0200648.1 TlpA disulfide reductase family protein [Nocardioides sp. AE5]